MIRNADTLILNIMGSVSLLIPLLVLVAIIVIHYVNGVPFIMLDFISFAEIAVIESILIAMTLYSVPLYIDIDDDTVYVKYIVRVSKICSVGDVVRVSYVSSLPLKSILLNISCVGIKGLFGVAAECKNLRNLDHCIAYLRRSRDLVLLVLKDGKKYLVAPRNTEDFLMKLRVKNPQVVYEHYNNKDAFT